MLLDKNVKAFLIHVISFSLSLMLIHFAKKAQIILLITKKVKILAKYPDFSNIFLEKKALILLELIKFNKYTIKL